LPPGDRTPTLHQRRVNDTALALAREWKRLGRAATFVAVLTSPVLFVLLYNELEWGVFGSLLGTIAGVAIFRGLIDVIAHRFVPRASLYGAGRDLLDDDVVSRRRLWWWRSVYRRLIQLALWLGIPMLILYSINGTTPADIWNSISTFFCSASGLPK